MNRDLVFISRRFDSVELPREKAYLYKYFRTKVQEAFLKYAHVFGDCTHFSDHTGHYCSPRWLKTLYTRMTRLESAHREAKKCVGLGEDDETRQAALEKLALIERGKYKL